MRKIREILRLKYEQGCSIQQIATSCNISTSTVSEYLFRARKAGITRPLQTEQDDTALERWMSPQTHQVPKNKRENAQILNIF